ncbi:MAG: radical SAM family heme chaperone HemW [Steroidobacteraceae bacterium]|nr:radical SAM family heme chaperone HemW [Steroidobacteraceae bacterium]
MTGLPPLALYVHMPWCVRKCPYCDFNSHELRRERPDARYVDALSRDFERELASIAGRTIQSVFFGGGTPSLFAAPEYARLLVQLRRQAPFAEDAEITLEANPGTVERGAFSAYRDAGINRVSLGAQTFDARALSVLGRIHSPEETLRAVEELRAAKLDNFNLDLMYGLPGQSPGEALADVATACALGSSHISHYQLTLEPGTVFHSRRPALPGEEVLWEMQTECQRLLADHGYAQYEVSAYARDGARCRHNLNYWRFGDYLGIGAGAHGKLSLELPGRVLRSVKPRMPGAYLAAACGTDASIGEREPILESSLPFEFMLNALRLNEGFRGADFEARTGLALARIEPKLQDAERRGLLVHTPDAWRPSELGQRFLNDLQVGFLP